MKTQVLTDKGLTIYDQEMKKYITENGITLEAVQNLINTSIINVSNEIFSSTKPTSQNNGDVWTKLI